MKNTQTSFSQSYVPFQPTLTAEGQSYFGLSLAMQPPTVVLSDAILAFLQVKVDIPTPYPMVPDGTNVLFFSSTRGLVGGTHLSVLEVQLMESGEYFGVWFKPGMLRQFFDVDVSEVTQSVVGDDYLSNRQFLYLSERLYEKEGFSERVDLCESLFLTSLRQLPLPTLNQALALIYQGSGSMPVEAIARQVGITRRHLNRLFSLHTGVSTKSFSQLIRTQTLLRRSYTNHESAFHTGLDLGFYDQSHIAKTLQQHDVVSLSSLTQQFMSVFYKPDKKQSDILFSP